MKTVLKIKGILSMNLCMSSLGILREKTEWNSGWRMHEVIGSGLAPLDLITLNPEGRSIAIQESPHYKYIQSNFSSPIYEDFLVRRGIIKIERQTKIFKELYDQIRLDPSNVSVLVLSRPLLKPSKKLELVDGCHRLAIMASLGFSRIKIKITY